jgi:branched-chain amino acid transport system ATP-binding protein
MPEPLLEFRGVKAAYEEVEVIHGIDATFDEGAVTAVLGANGAGKSTLLALAVGVMGPTQGEVRFAGEKVRLGSTAALARQGLCLIPEGRGVFPNLTVRENLWVMTHSGRGRRHVEKCAFDRFPRLAERRDQPAGTMSGGEQQMLALARAVATNPRLLMLDELSMGLAPLVVEELYRHVVSLASEGITVVVVEQFARTALSVATSAMVMANGRIVQTGDASDVESVLQSAYLGPAQPADPGSVQPAAEGSPTLNGSSDHTGRSADDH